MVYSDTPFLEETKRFDKKTKYKNNNNKQTAQWLVGTGFASRYRL